MLINNSERERDGWKRKDVDRMFCYVVEMSSSPWDRILLRQTVRGGRSFGRHHWMVGAMDEGDSRILKVKLEDRLPKRWINKSLKLTKTNPARFPSLPAASLLWSR